MSHEEKAIERFDTIILPYIAKSKEELDLPPTQKISSDLRRVQRQNYACLC